MPSASPEADTLLPDVEFFIKTLISAIESKDLNTEGLYRVNPSIVYIRETRYFVDENYHHHDKLAKKLKEEKNINNLAGLFKAYFRELSQQLVNESQYLFKFNEFVNQLNAKQNSKNESNFQESETSGKTPAQPTKPNQTYNQNVANSNPDNINMKQEIQKFIHQEIFVKLPENHQMILKLILPHLCNVVKAEHNKMDRQGLAKVFAPTICYMGDSLESNLALLTQLQAYGVELINEIIDPDFCIDFLKMDKKLF